jgi:hypothetical protein
MLVYNYDAPSGSTFKIKWPIYEVYRPFDVMDEMELWVPSHP